MPADRHILVVEDNPGDIRLMREALRELQPGVVLDVAMDADQALKLLHDPAVRRPSLIFLDFNLPKAGSKDLLKLIKDHHELRVIPVAVLTTSEAERDIQEAYKLYANCYLCKPVDLDGFFDLIRTAARFWLEVACTVEEPRVR